MISDASNNSGCLSTIFRLFGIKPERESGPLPYRIRDDFLSPAEKSFFHVLALVVGNQAIVCTKVNLNDIFFVQRPHENQAYRNRIDRKHVDFLLCDPSSLQPIVGIELDDSSHSRTKQLERDEFVERVFETAGLPLVRIPVQASYNTHELSMKLSHYLDDTAKDLSLSVEALKIPNTQTTLPLCPKCNIPMVLRTVTKGEHQGKQFYGCPNFPKCREVKPFYGVIKNN